MFLFFFLVGVVLSDQTFTVFTSTYTNVVQVPIKTITSNICECTRDGGDKHDVVLSSHDLTTVFTKPEVFYPIVSTVIVISTESIVPTIVKTVSNNLFTTDTDFVFKTNIVGVVTHYEFDYSTSVLTSLLVSNTVITKHVITDSCIF